MDQDILRQIEYFSAAANQNAAAADGAAGLAGSAPAQMPGFWETAALIVDGTAAESPTTMPASLSMPSFGPLSTVPSSLSFRPTASPTVPDSPTAARTILRTRAPRTREGHERKRSRLGSGVTPYDSIDYWLEFDNEERIAELANSTRPQLELDANARGQDIRPPPPPSPPLRRVSTASHGLRSAPGSTQTLKPDDVIDDSALDNALSDEDDDFSSMNLAEQLSKIDSMPPSEVPPREGLYSTPLSWEKPQMGLRIDSLIGLQSPTLSEAEQRRLIAIAMNRGPSMGGLGSSLNNFDGLGSPLGSGLGTASMSQISRSLPEHARAHHRSQPQTPRPTLGDKGKEKEKTKIGERAAHNDIEKKYRTNLKDKIAELRDAVPSLRTIPEDSVDDGDTIQPPRAPKVSKGTVLLKATEYIHYLEKKNRMIVQQHQQLSKRLQAFEQLLQAAARPTFQMPTYSRTLFDPRAFC